MSPISTRICVPNLVAVRRSCRKRGGVQTDRQRKLQLYNIAYLGRYDTAVTSSRISSLRHVLLSRNGEESFNTLLSPDPDYLRGAPSQGDNVSCVQNQGNRRVTAL